MSMKFVCDGCGKSIDADARNGNLVVQANVAPRWTQAGKREMGADACSEACAAKVIGEFGTSLDAELIVATKRGKSRPIIRRGDLIVALQAAYDSGVEGDAAEAALERLLDALDLDIKALLVEGDALSKGYSS